MIAVGGFNTAIDKLLEVDEFHPGVVTRAHAATEWPGGKGVHAALCVADLGETVRLAGVINAAQRTWFASWLQARSVQFIGIEIARPVRTCLTIRDGQGRTTEIRETGPGIVVEEWRELRTRFVTLGREANVAVLSGSVPPGVPPSGYRDIVSDLAGVRVVVDAGGELLRHAIEARPFCIKPNREEAEALTGVILESPPQAASVARQLAARGIPLVIISMGAAGAVACWQDRVCHVVPPRVDAINVVGAGDCVTAGVAVGLARECDIEEVLRLGVASGTAKTLSPEIGLVRREDIDRVLPEVRLKWLD
jgi:tagatose 6-phosphate kinase